MVDSIPKFWKQKKIRPWFKLGTPANEGKKQKAWCKSLSFWPIFMEFSEMTAISHSITSIMYFFCCCGDCSLMHYVVECVSRHWLESFVFYRVKAWFRSHWIAETVGFYVFKHLYMLLKQKRAKLHVCMCVPTRVSVNAC